MPEIHNEELTTAEKCSELLENALTSPVFFFFTATAPRTVSVQPTAPSKFPSFPTHSVSLVRALSEGGRVSLAQLVCANLRACKTL